MEDTIFNAVKAGTHSATVTLNGNTGTITAGGKEGQGGQLSLKDATGATRVEIRTEALGPAQAVARPAVSMDGTSGMVTLRKGNSDSIVLNPQSGNIHVGGPGAAGNIFVLPENSSEPFIHLDGRSGMVTLRKDQRDCIVLNPQSGNIYVGGPQGPAAGNIFVYPEGGPGGLFQPALKPRIHLDGQAGGIVLSKGEKKSIMLNADSANIYVGGPDGAESGNIFLYAQNATDPTIELNGKTGRIFFNNGECAGDITLQNADCAEEFEISELEEGSPGTVMVLDQEGKLRQSRQAYDKRVAGVVSGAGDCKPGIVLGKQYSEKGRALLALMGKVYCKVDAEYSPIDVGDLLTTSDIPGHAMKADDPVRAFGAVIGKALRPLKAGQALVPILVALQ